MFWQISSMAITSRWSVSITLLLLLQYFLFFSLFSKGSFYSVSISPTRSFVALFQDNNSLVCDTSFSFIISFHFRLFVHHDIMYIQLFLFQITLKYRTAQYLVIIGYHTTSRSSKPHQVKNLRSVSVTILHLLIILSLLQRMLFLFIMSV